LVRFWGETMTGLKRSRSRPYQKNDNRFVEQKNDTLVRQYFGPIRLETPEPTGCATRECAASAAERECLERDQGWWKTLCRPDGSLPMSVHSERKGGVEPVGVKDCGRERHHVSEWSRQRVDGETFTGSMPVPLASVRTPANDGGHAGAEEREVVHLCLSLHLFWQTLSPGGRGTKGRPGARAIAPLRTMRDHRHRVTPA
jgi:hypothetical protein